MSELVARHGKDLSDLRTKHAADNEAFDKAVVQANELMAALSGFKLDSDEVERQQKLTEQANNRSEQAGLIQAQQRVCEAQIRGECGQTFAYRDHEIKSDWYDDAMPDINAARFGRQHLQQVLAE